MLHSSLLLTELTMSTRSARILSSVRFESGQHFENRGGSGFTGGEFLTRMSSKLERWTLRRIRGKSRGGGLYGRAPMDVP